MNYCNFIIFDFETDGVNPEVCQPIQIAACVINPRSLTPYDNGKFHSYIRPDFDKLNLSALEVNKITKEQLMAAPSPKVVWKQFNHFVRQFDIIDNKVKKKPIGVGYNSISFDMTIVKRLDELIKAETFSHITLDLYHMIFVWFESNGMLESLSFDSVRQFFKLSSKDAHNAIKDVEQVTDIFVKFMRLHREVSKDIIWN